MINSEDIIEKIKDILSNTNNKKIFDKDVSLALGMAKNQIAQCRIRESIPFRQILEWCYKNNIDSNTIFFNKGK